MKKLIIALLFLLGLGAAPAMAASCDGIFPPSTACATVSGGTAGPVPFSAIIGGPFGTMALQDANAVAITGGNITGMPLPFFSSDVANKQYVDNSIVGLIIHSQALLATATALPANAYNNGTSGVGATLTGNSNGALTVDGVLTTSSNRIVVKNEAAPANNGIYVVTTVGDGSNPYVLTRATDADTPGTSNPAEIGFGTYVFVTSGTANSDTGWSVTSVVTTIGTSAINWAQFSVGGGTGGNPGGTSGQIQYNNAGTFGGFTMSGDATLVPSTGVITVGPTIHHSLTVNVGSSTFGGLSVTGTSNPVIALNNGVVVPIICLSTGTNQCAIGDVASDIVVKNTGHNIIFSTDSGPGIDLNIAASGLVSGKEFAINPSGAADALNITQNLNGATNQAILVSQTATGAISTTGFNYNLINITSDNAQCGANSFCNGFTVQEAFGGSATIGGRQAIQASITLTSPTSASNTNRNYVAGTFTAIASTGDGGTNTGGGSLGGLFALNPVVVALPGATNLGGIAGGEVDYGMDTTATVRDMVGWSIISGYNGGQNGGGTAARLGTAISIAGITGPTLDTGIVIDDINGAWPIKTGGSLEKVFITGSTPTVADGTNWIGVTFSDCAFKSTNFCVGGNGSVTGTLANFTADPGSTGAPIGVFKNVHDTTGDYGLIVAAGPTGTDNSTWLILFEDGPQTGGVGVITRSGTGVTYATSSDERRKTNIHNSASGLNDLMQIKVRDFNFLASPTGGVAPQLVNGFVAQELEPIYPDAVTVGGDDPWKQPWSVDYGRITPLIVKSIQDMQHEIDDLRTARH